MTVAELQGIRERLTPTREDVLSLLTEVEQVKALNKRLAQELNRALGIPPACVSVDPHHTPSDGG